MSDYLYGLSQCHVCVLAEVPLPRATSDFAHVTPNVDAFLCENLLEQQLFRSGPKRRINKVTGFVVPMGNMSLRRTQLAISYFVAAICHKLMGDTFSVIATQLSQSENT